MRGSDKFVLDKTTFTALNDGFSFARVTSDAAADNSMLMLFTVVPTAVPLASCSTTPMVLLMALAAGRSLLC